MFGSCDPGLGGMLNPHRNSTTSLKTPGDDEPSMTAVCSVLSEHSRALETEQQLQSFPLLLLQALQSAKPWHARAQAQLGEVRERLKSPLLFSKCVSSQGVELDDV